MLSAYIIEFIIKFLEKFKIEKANRKIDVD